ncbi:hypothetical protein F5Y16DRAFT_359861 [Xylariaceae sp. FL0255]|nr:hypothetical protein F5Y16DRAFT_359861 [Xylariaceae sp. FL0255]
MVSLLQLWSRSDGSGSTSNSSTATCSNPLALAPIGIITFTVGIPAAVGAVYAAYKFREHTRRTKTGVSIKLVRFDSSQTKPYPFPFPLLSDRGDPDDSEPADVAEDNDVAAVVVARECVVSEVVSVPRSLVRGSRKGNGNGRGGRGLLDTYLGTTMGMFTRTPQAMVMKKMVRGLGGLREDFEEGGMNRTVAPEDTFGAEFLDTSRFAVGERICGVYVVRDRFLINEKCEPVREGEAQEEGQGNDKSTKTWGERVLLDLSPPEGWKGPIVHGLLDCGFIVEEGDESKGKRGLRKDEDQSSEKTSGDDDDDDDELVAVRFFNETIMWRQGDIPGTLLEGKLGCWFHTFMVRWMVCGGVDAVVERFGGRVGC